MHKSVKTTFIATTIALSSLGLGACATTASDSNMSAADTITAARASLKKAASVGGEWRDSGKILKKATALLTAGKEMKAAKLARKAQQQGMLGYKQAMSQNMDNLHI